jgi:hypothetical protein
MSSKTLAAAGALALAAGLCGQLAAQFPGGGNGPLQIPGQVGLPAPGRSRVPGGSPTGTTSGPRNEPEAKQPLDITTGMLRRLDAGLLVLEAADSRVITFRTTSKTKFFRDGEANEAPTLQPGDRIEVEATRDDDFYLYAVNVTLVREGTAEERRAASEPVQSSSKAPPSSNPSENDDDDRPVLRRNEGRGENSRANETKDDDDRPILRRGGSSSGTESARSQDAAASNEEPVPVVEEEADREPAQARAPAGPLEVPAPAPADPDDPGRPVLSRSGRARRVPPAEVAVNREPSPPPRAAEPSEPASARAPSAPARPSAPSPATGEDPLLAMARQFAAGFTESLPNYLAQEVMTRFASTSPAINWRALDVITAEIVYENEAERYRNIKIDGKATDKSIEELPGAWSTGEFGSILADVFHPATATVFRRQGSSTASGRNARKYGFSVARENSNWSIQAPSQLVRPAYRGSVWIETETGAVLRIEMQADAIPRDFPLDNVESAIDYEYVRIGDGEFLVPVHGETLSCTRGTNNCSRNTIDFRNYRKYGSETSVSFEDK